MAEKVQIVRTVLGSPDFDRLVIDWLRQYLFCTFGVQLTNKTNTPQAHGIHFEEESRKPIFSPLELSVDGTASQDRLLIAATTLLETRKQSHIRLNVRVLTGSSNFLDLYLRILVVYRKIGCSSEREQYLLVVREQSNAVEEMLPLSCCLKAGGLVGFSPLIDFVRHSGLVTAISRLAKDVFTIKCDVWRQFVVY